MASRYEKSDCSDQDVGGFLTSDCSDQDVVNFLTLLDEVLKDYKDKDKEATETTSGRRSATSTGCGTAPAEAEPKPKGKRVKMRTFKAVQQEAREKNRGPPASQAARSKHPLPERAEPKQVHGHGPCDPADCVLPCKEDLARMMKSGTFGLWNNDEDERYSL